MTFFIARMVVVEEEENLVRQYAIVMMSILMQVMQSHHWKTIRVSLLVSVFLQLKEIHQR